MPLYPGAIWHAGNSAGNYIGGPWRIVWHTTGGHNLANAILTLAKHNYWPHFTMDEDHVYQHINTDFAARALQNHAGGVETNRWHAVQIEMVARAEWPKTPALLAQAARLARWIESAHGIPQIWPNGYPLPAQGGHDPGGHNRNAQNWLNQGGHYGHCHVPENTHWDPGTIDVAALMSPV
jgi:hypothetical protein